MRGPDDLKVATGDIEDIDFLRQRAPAEIAFIHEPFGVGLFRGPEEQDLGANGIGDGRIGSRLFVHTGTADRKLNPLVLGRGGFVLLVPAAYASLDLLKGKSGFCEDAEEDRPRAKPASHASAGNNRTNSGRC